MPIHDFNFKSIDFINMICYVGGNTASCWNSIPFGHFRICSHSSNLLTNQVISTRRAVSPLSEISFIGFVRHFLLVITVVLHNKECSHREERRGIFRTFILCSPVKVFVILDAMVWDKCISIIGYWSRKGIQWYKSCLGFRQIIVFILVLFLFLWTFPHAVFVLTFVTHISAPPISLSL